MSQTRKRNQLPIKVNLVRVKHTTIIVLCLEYGRMILWHTYRFIVPPTPFQLNGSFRTPYHWQKLYVRLHSITPTYVTYYDAQPPQVARRLDLDCAAPRAGTAHLGDIFGTRVHFQDLPRLDALDERAVSGEVSTYVRPDLATRYREEVTHTV